MKNKYLLIIVIILSIIAVFGSRKNTTFFEEKNNNDNNEVKLYDPITDKVSTLDLENYVIGVVAAEMPASFNEEALKAQAVAARTYALYMIKNSKQDFDLIADVSNQAYISEDKMKEKWQNEFSYYYKKVTDAVNSTTGLVMKYNDEVIASYYFAMSNGSTENVALVFGESRDYLTSVSSDWEKNVNNFQVSNTISKTDFCQKLGITCGNVEITDIEKSDTGRVNSITINNKIFKGTEVRKLLNLRSTDFTILVNTDVTITTKGYGHGVGMSQYGANEMAKLGYKYEEILKYYYKNIEINKI